MSNEAIQELKSIFFEELGSELSKEEAIIVGNSLVAFFESLLKIQNENEYQKTTK